jgi:hypothetical protein
MMGNLRVDANETSLSDQRVQENSLGRTCPRAPEEMIGHISLNRNHDFFARVEDKLGLVFWTEPNSLKRIRRVP